MSYSSSDSEDSYIREEGEQLLYCQIYHDSAGADDNVNAYRVGGATDNSARSDDVVAVNQDIVSSDSTPTTTVDGCKPHIPLHIAVVISSEEDNSDIEVVKEVLLVGEGGSESANGRREHRKRKLSASVLSNSSLDEDDEVPLWARLGLDGHTTDPTLNVHIRTHGRQRHDSILSHTGSALGDNDTDPLVTLAPVDKYATLEQVLSRLPDDGWDISPSDYKTRTSGRKRPRYHNMECKNCGEMGHRSDCCPKPPQKACSICSEVHTRAKDRRYCPQSLCIWCLESGHYSQRCSQRKAVLASFCHRCRSKSHKSKNCHELWRQWHATTSLPEGCIYPFVPKDSKPREVLYCSQCGLMGHTAHECRSVPWWQPPILSTHIQHYNLFGKESDFKKTWCKRSNQQRHLDGGKSKQSDESRRELGAPISADKQTSKCHSQEDGEVIWEQNSNAKVKGKKRAKISTKRKDISTISTDSKQASSKTVKSVKGKRLAKLATNWNDISTIPTDSKQASSKTVKSIKGKKLAKRNDISTNKKQTLNTVQSAKKVKANHAFANTSNTKKRTDKKVTKPVKIKPSKAERKARKKLKEQLGIPVTQSVASFMENSEISCNPAQSSRKQKRNRKATQRRIKRQTI